MIKMHMVFMMHSDPVTKSSAMIAEQTHKNESNVVVLNHIERISLEYFHSSTCLRGKGA